MRKTRNVFLALFFCALPAVCAETQTEAQEAQAREVVTQSGIRIAGQAPQPRPVAPPRPLRLKSEADKKPKKQYKAPPPSWRSTIRFGFKRSARSTIRYAGR